jgi:hypothetical protein
LKYEHNKLFPFVLGQPVEADLFFAGTDSQVKFIFIVVAFDRLIKIFYEFLKN